METIKLNKLNKKKEFKVNDFLTIKNFELFSDEIFKFMKFGEPYDYLKFSGTIENKKVIGFVCLEDENIYNLNYSNN